MRMLLPLDPPQLQTLSPLQRHLQGMIIISQKTFTYWGKKTITDQGVSFFSCSFYRLPSILLVEAAVFRALQLLESTGISGLLLIFSPNVLLTWTNSMQYNLEQKLICSWNISVMFGGVNGSILQSSSTPLLKTSKFVNCVCYRYVFFLQKKNGFDWFLKYFFNDTVW